MECRQQGFDATWTLAVLLQIVPDSRPTATHRAVERQRTGDHIAFHVSKATLEATVEKLKTMKLEFILARSDSSLYFFDYDNHVFELDTTDIERDLIGES